MAKKSHNPVVYRGIKIAANLVKGVLGVKLRLNPHQRRALPHYVPAKRTGLPAKAIPRIVWQTNYTDRVTLPIYANFSFNRWLTPEFEYRYQTDEDCAAFVEKHFPGRYAKAFSRLQVGAAKADFWRILVILKYGGLYLDIDSNFCARPEDVIGARDEAVFIAMDDGEVTNYCLGAMPGHPAFARIAERIVENIEAGTLKSVYAMTGPVVVHEVVTEMGIEPINFRRLCTQGQFTNKSSQYADKKNGAWWLEQRQGIVGDDE